MDGLTTSAICFGRFEIDTGRRRLLEDGEAVPLNPKAYELLLVLAQKPGELISKSRLMDLVWENQFVEENNLTVHIAALRKALGEQKNENRFIVTESGKGYRFVAEINERFNEDIIVESRKFERIVIEEEIVESPPAELAAIQTGDFGNAKKFSFIKGRSKGRIAVIALAAAVLVSIAGFWYFQARTAAGQNMTALWTGPGDDLTRSRQLTASGKVEMAALSPDGNYYAYATGQTDTPGLWLAHTEGNSNIELRPPEAVRYEGVTFTPGGNEVYYVAQSGGEPKGALYRIPVFGGVPRKVLSDINNPVTFSPDGKRIAFVRSRSIVAADAETGANETVIAVTSSPSLSKHGAAWSPDGNHIAVGTWGEDLGASGILLVDVRDGTSQPFGDRNWNSVRRLAWLKDGSGLLANVIDEYSWEDRHIWLLDYPGGAAHKLTQGVFQYGAKTLGVSDNGTKLLGLSSIGNDNLFVGPAENPIEAKQVTSNAFGRKGGSNGVVWLNNGDILFSEFFSGSQTIWTAKPDGSDARPLTTPGFLDRHPAVSREGSNFVFQSSRGGSWNIWRASLEGGEPVQITEIGGTYNPSISPSGDAVLFEAKAPDGIPSIWRIPIDGGQPVRLTEQRTGHPVFSPDGRSFACIYRPKPGAKRQLAVFPIEGGKPTHIFDITAANPQGLRWLPDGTAIIFGENGQKLWRQWISGGAPETIVDLPGQTITSFDFSTDGKQFVMSRGESLQDVVLFTNRAHSIAR